MNKQKQWYLRLYRSTTTNKAYAPKPEDSHFSQAVDI